MRNLLLTREEAKIHTVTAAKYFHLIDQASVGEDDCGDRRKWSPDRNTPDSVATFPCRLATCWQLKSRVIAGLVAICAPISPFPH